MHMHANTWQRVARGSRSGTEHDRVPFGGEWEVLEVFGLSI